METKSQAQVEALIEKVLSERKTVIVAIDGRCGAGKTTLAAALAERFRGTVFHLDDFYLSPQQRAKRIKKEGFANADLKRFENEVLKNISRKEPFSYFKYLPKSGTSEEVKVEVLTAVNIVEGSFCTDASLRAYFDLKIFLTAGLEQRLERLLKRKENIEEYINKWIPYEENFFRKQGTESAADVVFDTGRE